jgi:hypothetical protein
MSSGTLRAEVTVGRLDRLAVNGASHATLYFQMNGATLQHVMTGPARSPVRWASADSKTPSREPAC